MEFTLALEFTFSSQRTLYFYSFFVNITILPYRLRILHPFRHGIPFVKSNALLEFRLFKRKLREIILQIIHQLADTFPCLVIYHKEPLTAHVLHPLSDHWNIGMWGIYLGDDPDQRPQEKISAAVTEQVKWLIGCLYDSDHIRLKGKAGQSYAEMLGFRIFSR